MSTKSGPEPDHDAHHGPGKHHHGDQHHGKHHKDHHGGGKHPPLRDATMKAGRARGESVTSHGPGGTAGTGHSPPHGRPRAGTLTRRDTGHGLQKHHRSHEHDRQSVGKQSDGHVPQVEYENTYKLEPDCRFQATKVREIIASVLKENLPEKEYEPRTMSRRCMELSDVIKERVKQLDMKRFKIVCVVFIGQVMDQSMMITSRCLWNFNYDNFSSSTVKKGEYYAVGMVFATYTE